MSRDALEYFYGITPERLNAMRNTPPPKSTDEVWKEHYRLQEEYIEELEAEIEEKRKDVVWIATEKAKLENYVKRLEEAGDALKASGYFGGFGDAVNKWIKAKEDKL